MSVYDLVFLRQVCIHHRYICSAGLQLHASERCGPSAAPKETLLENCGPDADWLLLHELQPKRWTVYVL